MVRFLLLLTTLTAATFAAVYFSSPYWLPTLSGNAGQIDQAKLLEIVKVVPAAIAAVSASIIAGGTSLISVLLQRRGARELLKSQQDGSKELLRLTQEGTGKLEENKNNFTQELENMRKEGARELLRLQQDGSKELLRLTQAGTGQLEENKNNFTRELEGIKNELAKSLERERIFLTLTREEIQRRLQWISAAQKVVSDYRSAIGTISTGEAVKSERSEPIEKQLSEIRDQMDPDTSLYVPWIIFHQRGLTLRALAQEKTSSGERQKLWTERGETGQPRNLAFGSAAQKVLELLRAEHDKLVRDRDVVSTAGASA